MENFCAYHIENFLNLSKHPLLLFLALSKVDLLPKNQERAFFWDTLYIYINTSQLPLNSREVVVVPVSCVVPHVGGEVGVDVGVREVRREAQAEDEASEDAEPASGPASDVA